MLSTICLHKKEKTSILLYFPGPGQRIWLIRSTGYEVYFFMKTEEINSPNILANHLYMAAMMPHAAYVAVCTLQCTVFIVILLKQDFIGQRNHTTVLTDEKLIWGFFWEGVPEDSFIYGSIMAMWSNGFMVGFPHRQWLHPTATSLESRSSRQIQYV